MRCWRAGLTHGAYATPRRQQAIDRYLRERGYTFKTLVGFFG